MAQQRFEQLGDLMSPPTVIPFDAKNRHVGIGDLHGNALKLIYILIEQGFLEGISEENYKTLKDIYYRNYDSVQDEGQRDSQIKRDLDNFRSIIESSIVNTKRSLTLIGDELADRGRNDYFTLLVIKKLHESHLDCDIILSNHSIEFFRITAKLMPSLALPYIKSIEGLRYLISRAIINKAEVAKLIAAHYIPLIKAIGYTLSPRIEELTLYTHAPVGLEIVQPLAKWLGTPFSDKNLGLFLNSIDFINDKMKRLMYRASKLVETLNYERQFIRDEGAPISPDAPLSRLVGNRQCGSELMAPPDSDDQIRTRFVYGHTDDLHLPTHMCLDDLFGKTDAITKEKYFTHQTNQFSVKQRTLCLSNALNNPKDPSHLALYDLLEQDFYTLYDLFRLSLEEFPPEAREQFITDYCQNRIVSSVLPNEQIILMLRQLPEEKIQHTQIVELLDKVDKSFWLENKHALSTVFRYELIYLSDEKLPEEQRSQILLFTQNFLHSFINQLQKELHDTEKKALQKQLNEVLSLKGLPKEYQKMINDALTLPSFASSVSFFSPSSSSDIPNPEVKSASFLSDP